MLEQGRLSEHELWRVVASVARQQGTGVLRLDCDGEVRSLHFCDGHLFLPRQHGLAKSLGNGSGANVDLHKALPLAKRIADFLAGLGAGFYYFDEEAAIELDELAGPLPTPHLVRYLLRSSLSAEEIRREIGHQALRWNEVERQPEPPVLDDAERGWLEEHRRRERIEPAAYSGSGEATLGELILTLRHLGALEPVSEGAAPAADTRRSRRDLDPEPEDSSVAVSSANGSAPSPDEQDPNDAFLEHIHTSLERRPLVLARELHRERIAELVGQVGSLSHFELLGVTRHASESEVHDAYEDLARLCHPAHATTLGWEGREDTLLMVFRAATRAYLVLSHPERRASYDGEIGAERRTVAVDDETRSRQVEQADRLAATAMEAEDVGDYQTALENLRQAVRLDPRSAYYVSIAELQLHNPHWTQRAISTLTEGLRADPENPDLHLAYAKALEKAGHRRRALLQYRSALARRPDDPDAQDALARLAERQRTPKLPPKTEADGKKRGFLHRFLGG